MATLKAVVRTARADGFYPVYIRVTHHRASSFIKTDKMVTKKELTKNNEIKDPFVLQYCTQRILEYTERLNKKDIENWTVAEVSEYLQNGDDDICFSDYARIHINRMIDQGQERNAKNYKLALQHLERFAGTTKVMFSHLTSQFVNKWIKSLEQTHRAKEMYPICMRQVFKAAILEYNDYDNEIIRIKTNPWVKVEIPEADKSEKLAITPEACREFFSFPIPESKMKYPLTEFGRDVAMMILCLAGMNTVDIYNLRKKDYSGGIIRYQRAKTKKFRADGAYMEMRVPAIIEPLFEKYRNTRTDDDRLFNFYQRMTSSDSFCANVNSGIKQICKAMGMPKEEWYSAYTFRHTWGTVAQNDCRASISEVAFAMNHSSAHKVTVRAGPSARTKTKAGCSCWTTSSIRQQSWEPCSTCTPPRSAAACRSSCCCWRWYSRNSVTAIRGIRSSNVRPRLYQKTPARERINNTSLCNNLWYSVGRPARLYTKGGCSYVS